MLQRICASCGRRCGRLFESRLATWICMLVLLVNGSFSLSQHAPEVDLCSWHAYLLRLHTHTHRPMQTCEPRRRRLQSDLISKKTGLQRYTMFIPDLSHYHKDKLCISWICSEHDQNIPSANAAPELEDKLWISPTCSDQIWDIPKTKKIHLWSASMYLVYPWYNLRQPNISQVFLKTLVYQGHPW